MKLLTYDSEQRPTCSQVMRSVYFQDLYYRVKDSDFVHSM